jgi:hypothetical protein
MNQSVDVGYDAAQASSPPPVHPLLDFNATNFDVNLFDETVKSLFNGSGSKARSPSPAGFALSDIDCSNKRHSNSSHYFKIMRMHGLECQIYLKSPQVLIQRCPLSF